MEFRWEIRDGKDGREGNERASMGGCNLQFGLTGRDLVGFLASQVEGHCCRSGGDLQARQ
jgi:hypothetical protein